MNLSDSSAGVKDVRIIWPEGSWRVMGSDGPCDIEQAMQVMLGAGQVVQATWLQWLPLPHTPAQTS